METIARGFPPLPAGIHAPAQLEDLLREAGLPGPAALGDPGLGTAVARARSSWVRRLRTDSFDCHIKTYDYPTATARWRGALRNTGPFCASRAAREAAALGWMARHGFPVPPFFAYHEERRLGFVVRAILVTATWPGSRLDHLATALAAGRRDLLGRELGRFVALLHATGFRDGNLDPRNVLAAEVGDRFALTKIDSPRFRVVAPGTRGDRLTRADWARLLPQLRALGLADATLAAARAAGADA